MKVIKYLLLLFSIFIILWVDSPENVPVNIPLGKKNIHFTINPPTLSFRMGDTQVVKDFRTKLGLDLRGGSHLTFDADTTKVKKEDLQDALNSSRDVIERRVNLFGVSEPVVQTVKSGDHYRISVDLPGIENVDDAVRLIGQTAQLTFKESSPQDPRISSQSAVTIPSKDTGLTGSHIKKAAVAFNQQNGQPEVSITFNAAGAKLFGDITTRNVGKQVGIYLDQYPISIPTVQQPILDGSAVINGSFTVEDAKKLAIAINSGALPLPIKLVAQRSIGPTLGALEVQKSVFAGAVGLFMVLFFMIAYYGPLGVIASMALIIYGLISFAIFRAIPVVLTLPGVAGFILSIGMAVDTNILIFERIKEELRNGRDFDIAIRLGFGRAIDAIKDANITTLIVSFILFNPLNWEFLPQFGLVRGFALTLAIGVATSLFTGIVITRRLIDIFYRKPVK